MTNPTSTSVDLFDELETNNTNTDTEVTETETETDVNAENEANAENDDNTSNTDSAPVEIFSSVPDGTMSVTEFAAHMTKVMMSEKIRSGEDLDGSEYVVPQAVYQTVKAAKNRIPHVLVQTPDSEEKRVYIVKETATQWWLTRREHLATRGSGTARASSRTPDDNLTLLGAAVEKELYAKDRLALWTNNLDQAQKLIVKYKGFLSEQEVSEADVDLKIQDATDQYNAEKAKKLAEKAKVAKAKKQTEELSENNE